MPISHQEPVDMNLPVRRLYFVKQVSNCFSIIIILSKFGKDSRKDKYRMFGLFDNEKKKNTAGLTGTTWISSPDGDRMTHHRILIFSQKNRKETIFMIGWI
jgi:hypothetical protein